MHDRLPCPAATRGQAPHPAQSEGWPTLATMRRRLLAIVAPACIGLAACGGGGGGGGATVTPADVVGPPATAATLANTTAEAQAAAQAVVAGADSTAARVSAMSGFAALTGLPVGPQSATGEGRKQALSASTMRPLAVETDACSDLLDGPCSGSVTIDASFDSSATQANPGDHADLQFASLSGGLSGIQLSLNGHLRVDFLSTFVFDSSNIDGIDVKLGFDGFGGSINGVTFGPVTDMLRLQISGQGVISYTAGGATFTSLSGVSITGPGSYAIGSGTVRVAYWADSSRYIDLTFQNWHVVDGRPAVGSQVTVSSGQGSIALTVSASSTASVVYAGTITVGSVTTAYTVTATYPGGGGSPTYTAVLAS